MPLIKHVYYCMSSHQSAHSADQIHCVFCQKNNSFVFWMTCSHKILLHTQCIYYIFIEYMYIVSLICRCKSCPTAVPPFSFLTSTDSLSVTPPHSLALAAQSEILDDWDELQDLSHSITGSILTWNITCNLWLLCIHILNWSHFAQPLEMNQGYEFCKWMKLGNNTMHFCDKVTRVNVNVTAENNSIADNVYVVIFFSFQNFLLVNW